MSNGNPNVPVSPKSTLDTLKEWKELILFVALTVSSALTGIFGNDHPRVQRASWILAVLFVGVGAYVVHRKQKRRAEQERREKIWAERESQRKAGSAFRSLAPFEERDELPGKDRKVEARAIATRIASDDFQFGVVCGDTGCGKTSMLRSEVTRALQASGFEVAYVRNPRRLESKISETLPPTERLASELRALSRNYIKATTGVVILDQFEEWFIEYQEPEHRLQIGKFIRKLAERPQRVRIVCAIRREFLIDFHDLSDELPQQLSTTNLFHIKNFTVDQAKDVISQCSTADGLVLDDSFAETAAHDLAEGGQVRPPELQIVCTYLAVSGGLNTPKYRQAGGTAGILARYIQEAISSSKDPDVAARLLRALCDFPVRSKQKPKTLDELTADVNVGVSRSDNDFVAGIAHHFVSGRILSEEQRQGGRTFVLIHDYLVDAVQLATSDASTKTEEANQLLRYYLAEQRGTIPFRKLLFIRRHAEHRYVEERNARQLIRKSVFAPFLTLGVVIAFGLALAGGLYLFLTARVQWEGPTLIGRHWPQQESGDVSVQRMPLNGELATGTYVGAKYFRLWDIKSGTLLKTIVNDGDGMPPRIDPSGRYVFFSKSKTQPDRLVDLSTMEVVNPSIGSPTFSRSGDWLVWADFVTSPSGQKIFSVEIYSTKRKELVANIRNVLYPPKTLISAEVNRAGDRLVVTTTEQSRIFPALFDISTGMQKASLRDEKDGDLMGFSVSDAFSQICTVTQPRGLRVSLWDVHDGRLMWANEFYGGGHSVSAECLPSQSYVFVRTRIVDPPGMSERVFVLPVGQTEPASIQAKFAIRQGEPIAYWQEEHGTRMVDSADGFSRQIAGMDSRNADLMISETRRTHSFGEAVKLNCGIWKELI